MDNYTQIQLPGVVIAGLYSHSLVITNDRYNAQSGVKGREIVNPNKEEEEKVMPQATVKWWLGDNLQNVVLLIHDANNVFIDGRNLDFLGKILQACRLNLADTAIVNLAKSPKQLEEIQQALQPKYLILFDMKPAQIGIAFPLTAYQPDRQNGCTYLLAGSLSGMNHDTAEAKQEKGRFWISLKQVFEL